MNILIGYPKCSTCKNAEKFLKDNNIKYEYRDIKLNTPTKEELIDIIKTSNLDIKKFFNTSGLVYRNLNLKDKLDNMNFDEKVVLLSSNGMLIKRPILLINNKVLVGFKQKEWLGVLK